MICKTLLLATSLWLASTAFATDSLALGMPPADSAMNQALPDSIPPLPPPDTIASVPLADPLPDSIVQPVQPIKDTAQPHAVATVAPYPADWPEPRKKEKQLHDTLSQLERSLRDTCSLLDAVLPPLVPKGEFEPSANFAKRQAAWLQKRNDRCAPLQAPLQKKKQAVEKSISDLRAKSTAFLGSLKITTYPAGATVITETQDSCITPGTLDKLWAGKTRLTLRLAGYQNWTDSAVIPARGQTTLTIRLQEQTPFSPADEVPLSALLAKDTPTIAVYQARITRVQKRIAQIDSEYPALTLGIAKTDTAARTNLQRQYQTYRTRLSRSIEVLQDYILAQAHEPKTLAIPSSALTLGTYDADRGKYAFTAQQQREGFALYYKGALAMSIPEAKATQKRTDGFTLQAKYYNIPVLFNGTPVYPAWHSLSVSRSGKPIAVEGAFQLPAEWSADPNLHATVLRADSLSKGLIHVRGLHPDYALEYGYPQKPAPPRTWMVVTRGLLFAASAAGLTYGYLQHRDAADQSDAYAPRNAAQGKQQIQDIRDTETRRNQAAIVGIAFALTGIITFAF